MSRRVVVTGIGIICPLGTTKGEFWRNCLQGHSVVSPIPSVWEEYANYRSRVWAPLPSLDYTTRGITRIETMQNDPFTLLALVAAREAIQDAGLSFEVKSKRQNTFTLNGIDPIRAGVYLGTGIGGANSFLANHSHQVLCQQKAKLLTSLRSLDVEGKDPDQVQKILSRLVHPPRFNPFSVSMLMPNAASAMLGIKFSLNGPNLTFALACAASTVAIGKAALAIRENHVDLALTGGAEFLRDEYGGIFQGFDIARTLAHQEDDPDRTNCPFDTQHSGFLFSEGGAGILVLEELNAALQRGASIVAEIVSYAETFDAHNMMSIAPDTFQIQRMIRNALDDAKLSAEDIDYINTHGTGTEVNDNLECQIIERMFGSRVLLNSTKSLTGHLIGASGAVEAAVTALSLKEQVTHECKNLRNPIADLNFVRARRKQDMTFALSQSFAFGGHNAALVLKRFTS